MELKGNELEALVKKVTGDVLGRIMIQPADETGRVGAGPKPDPRLLVLVPRYIINLQKYLEYLADKHPGNVLVFGCMGRINESVQGMKQVVDIVDISDESSSRGILDGFDSFGAVYCVSPGIKLLDSIAQYNDTGFIENLMIHSVLHQKPAGILTDYDAGNLPGGISKKVRDLKAAIIDMGIKIYTIGSKSEVSLNQSSPVDSSSKGKGRELITEKDIDAMYKNGIRQIRIANGCIITPLAKDRAKEVGITIV